MSLHLYTGAAAILEGINVGHITFMFSDLVASRKVLNRNVEGCEFTITSVVHWPIPNITVAICECAAAMNRHKEYTDAGFSYDFEYIPHITLSQGDNTREYAELVGQTGVLGHEYMRIFEK